VFPKYSTHVYPGSSFVTQKKSGKDDKTQLCLIVKKLSWHNDHHFGPDINWYRNGWFSFSKLKSIEQFKCDHINRQMLSNSYYIKWLSLYILTNVLSLKVDVIKFNSKCKMLGTNHRPHRIGLDWLHGWIGENIPVTKKTERFLQSLKMALLFWG